MRREELLHGLRQGEFHIHLPAVGQHHDEEGQPAAGGTDGDRAELAPIHLGGLTGGEGQGQEGLARPGADRVHVLLDDADATLEACLDQTLEDLLGRQRMGVQPGDDASLEGIELARPQDLGAGLIGPAGPVAYGLHIQPQALGELGRREVLRSAVADRAPGGIVDHGRSPSTACRLARRVAMGTDSGRSSTW